MVEKLRFLLEKVRATDEFQRIVLEKSLGTLFVLIGLAENLCGIDLEVRIPRPPTIPYVSFDQMPVTAVVTRIVSFRMTVLPSTSTVLVTDPKKNIGLRMEVKDWSSESVWYQGTIEWIP
jgi:hypothetical protein